MKPETTPKVETRKGPGFLPGIDPQMLIHDRLGRPHHIAHGFDPIAGILA